MSNGALLLYLGWVGGQSGGRGEGSGAWREASEGEGRGARGQERLVGSRVKMGARVGVRCAAHSDSHPHLHLARREVLRGGAGGGGGGSRAGAVAAAANDAGKYTDAEGIGFG